jgi:hypothetical protein
MSEHGEPGTSERPSNIAVLKETPTNRHLLRGFGPLLVGLILFVLMVLLAPTVARERDVTIEGPAPTVSTTN